tara:strand:+ start:3619 stop:3828 length:210 start_codon:yes stop_codon:yes gene_type:complete
MSITYKPGDGLDIYNPNIQFILEDVYNTIKQKKQLTDEQLEQYERVLSVLPLYIAAHKNDIVYKEMRCI